MPRGESTGLLAALNLMGTALEGRSQAETAQWMSEAVVDASYCMKLWQRPEVARRGRHADVWNSIGKQRLSLALRGLQLSLRKTTSHQEEKGWLMGE